jgi:hypothetical protein
VALALSALACSDHESNDQVSNQPPSFNNTVWSLVQPTDGSGDLYAGGDFTSYDAAQAIRIVRLNDDGTIDPGFATGVGFNGSVRSVVPVGGNLYVGGDFTTYNGIQAIRIARLTANGSFDPAFATATGFNNTVHVITPVADGSGDVYVGGDFTTFNGIPANRLVRLKADGTVNPAFVTGTGFNNTVFTAIPAADGSGDLYVGGAFSTYNGVTANNLVRLNSNGTVDPMFDTGTGFDNTVYTLAPAAGGDLYAGGGFSSYNGSPVNGLVRLNSNGVRDLSLATGAGFNNTVFSLAPAVDGSEDLYAGGAFTSYNGTQATNLVRLNSNGTVDPSFATGTGFSNTVLRVVPAGGGSGDVYAGGEFTQYQFTPIGRLVRLTSTGAFVR